MHFSSFEVFLIALCTISSVVHRSFVNGLANSTEIKLERPAFCVLFWGLSRLCYPVKLSKKDKQNFRLEIKEESSKNWQNVSDDQGHGIFNWTKFLNSTSKYQVRAVLGNITGQELEFHTNCNQRFSPPTDFNVTYTKDETLELIWNHEDLDLKAANYCVKLVDSGTAPGIPIWKLYNRAEKQPGQISGGSNDFAVISTNLNGSLELEKMELRVPRKIDLWSGEICPSNAKNCMIKSRNITYGQKNSSINVTVNRLSKPGESINSFKKFLGNAFMTVNRTIGEIGDASWSLQSNEIYIIEVTVHDPISNVSASIKIKFWTNKTPDILFWVMLVIMIVLLLLICLVCYRGYKSRRARMKGPMLIVKYRNSSSSRLMSQSDDSPFRFSAYLPYLREFESYVNDAAENGILEYQFRSLPKGLTRPCQYGRLPNNKPKNRYGNLIPYDGTRVILDKGSDQQYSDYINANYIHGYLKEKAYIATQGPLPGTIVDFWRMIWQEKVRIICMLVDLFEDGQKMCEQYWPEVDGTMDYDNFLVVNVQQRVFAHYTYRTFWVTTRSRKEMRKVEHLQYTGWPKEGVPMYSHSVAEYLTKLRSIPAGEGPIVMHCSGGTGRTGAIILCDITLRHFAAEQKVNVFDEAKKMYRARANMLRNFPEYVLAHLVPSHCLLFLPTKVPCSQISPLRMAEMKTDLSVHMKRLDDCSWMDNALRPLGPLRPPHPENLAKNRFPELTPVGDRLVTLTRYPTYDEHSTYISAVSVDGVRSLNQYLASQLPMPSTLTDLWRLIIEKNVELVIILQRPDPEDETCCIVVPRRTTVIPIPNVKVEVKMRSKSGEHFTKDILLLTDSSVKPAKARTITTLTCNKWSYGKDATPPPPEALVALWVASENIRRVEGPTLVLCHNGVTGCGLYLALSFMLERMAVERECDVILAVRAVRRSRPEFVNSKAQFEYLYDAAEEYSESFRTYNNFR